MENKYDTSVTMKENSSLTYLLRNVDRGSKVLEFGPATGYMTQYLKEELKCQVYIVEIDADAFKKAIVFAEDGVCGSAEDKEWLERFQNIRFDYILFADVLEHLVNPWNTLKMATELLKEDTGKILVSLPNIAHNAVLVDLFNGKFEYRKTGIMDNTHLRFFTHDSALDMFRKCGLYVVDEDAVIFDLNYTHFGNSEKDVSEDVWSELRLRKYGFVNQFLFTLSQNEKGHSNITDKKTLEYESALYYRLHEGYSEDNKVVGTSELFANCFVSRFQCQEGIRTDRIKIEILPFQGIVEDFQISLKTKEKSRVAVGGYKEDQRYYFYNGKIAFDIQFQEETLLDEVEISGKLKSVQVADLRAYIEQRESVHAKTNVALEEKNVVVQQLQGEIKAYQTRDEEIGRLNKVIEEKLAIIWQLQDEVRGQEKLYKEIERLNGVAAEYERTLQELQKEAEK